MGRISLKHMLIQISSGLDAVEADFLGVSKFHGKRVALYCLAIGRALGYDDLHLFTMAGCALLHDNALTEYLISERPGNAQAFNRRAHCVKGQENCHYFPFPTELSGFVLYHHEYANGQGAFGKKAGEYPMEAGIIALADQIDTRFSMTDPTQENIVNIQSYLARKAGHRYEENLAALAAQILTPEFLTSLQTERVSESLECQMPDVVSELSEQETIRIAGIVAQIIDYKSSFTREHTMQIANKAWHMSGVYGYDHKTRADIYLAAALHDLGKLFIPTTILEKPGKLTEEEFEWIKSHARYTWECLHDVPGMEEIAQWASNHHEKLDGSGYPFGKCAKELDFISRLIACLDIYQAVREARPYHPQRNHVETMAILKEMAGNGYIDRIIVQDLDLELAKLQDGISKAPVLFNAEAVVSKKL